MLVNDFCEEGRPQSPCHRVGYSYQNGYFGKPTKERTSEPSMFEILTWNQQGNQERSLSPEGQACCNCHCKCSKEPHGQQREKERKSCAPHGNSSAKKIPETSPKRQQPKEKQQHKGINVKNQYEKSSVKNVEVFNSQARPKSAGGSRPKAVKIMTSPAKLPKFIGEMMQKEQQEREEEPKQTKEKLIEKFKQTTRWIPNSAFTTYFGKPAFQNYGRGNTNPAFGGLMYGNYLKTHNIQPHRGVNSPKNIQCYNIALTKGQEAGALYPYPPKAGKKPLLADRSEGGDLQCSQIYPEDNNMRSLPIHPPNLYDLQKFGGKGIQKVSRARLSRSQLDKENQSYVDDHESTQNGGRDPRKQMY